MTLIKSISGIRGTIGGTVGDNLTPLDVVRFAAAWAGWLRGMNPGKRCSAVVGRDARVSGPMVAGLVLDTLRGCGVDVIDLGPATTPTVELAVTGLGADGGIIVTASHNPAQWNALKLLDGRGEFLDAAAGKAVLDRAAAEDFDFAPVDELGEYRAQSYDDEHIRQVLALSLVDVEAVRAKKFRAVVDAVNSVGGTVMPKLLRAMGVEVVELNCIPDGLFNHDPEPLAKNLTEISEKVRTEKADLGVVVDPDVDRLALVCEDGTMFGEEYTLVAVADHVLAHTPGGTVSNLSSSRALADVTRKYGQTYAASAVGEVNVVAKMKQTGAVIGGEGNGGVIFPEAHYGRDALVGAALFLTLLAKSGKTMTALRAGYPEYHMVKDKITLPSDAEIDAFLNRVKEKFAGEKVDTTDGVKIDLTDGWLHLRRSNTEPIVRIYAEAPTEEEARALVARIGH